MKKINEFISISFYYWLPFTFWALIIFSFSARPTGTVSVVSWQDFIFKKTIHLIEYAVFTLLLYRALTASGADRKKALFISFFTAVLYGASDEFHQTFTPGRTPKLRDVGIDSFGSFLSLLAVVKLPDKPSYLKKFRKLLNLEYK